jgi:hypothetical protein
MPKSKTDSSDDKKNAPKNTDELFEKDPVKNDEIESDGSASAFDETERVSEDNFDDLSEK